MKNIKRIMQIAIVSLMALTILVRPVVTSNSSSSSNNNTVITPFSDIPDKDNQVRF